MLKLRRPRLGALNLTLLAVLLALGSGGGWLVWGQPDASETAATTTAQVTKTDVTSTVSADGTVAPNDSADVSFDTDGIISRIPVEVGDAVKVGDVLAFVSNSTAAAELKSAKASLKAAKANREAVEEETDDDGDGDGDSDSNDATSTEMTDEERDKERTSAKASVEQARVSVLQAEEAIGDLTLRAPVAGTVIAINKTVGSSTDGTGSDSNDASGNTFATIADMSSWVVECDFAEADVAKVKEGSEVKITFGAVPNETFTGRIRKIDLSATTSENVTTYGVEVDVLNAPSELRDGASASITVTTASATDVIAVPTSAIATDAQGASTVKLVKNGKSTSRTVQIGIKGDTYTEIKSGLSVGDTIELGATSTSSDSRQGDQMVEMKGPKSVGGGPVVRGVGG